MNKELCKYYRSWVGTSKGEINCACVDYERKIITKCDFVQNKGCWKTQRKEASMNEQLLINLLERLEEETRYCRTCKHRKRYQLNEYSSKVVQCCDLQPSNCSNSGYKTIKVTNLACGFYEPKKGGTQ